MAVTRNTTQQKKPRVFWWFGGRIIHLETDKFSAEAEQDSSSVRGAVGPLLAMAGMDRLSVCFVFLQAKFLALTFNIYKKPHQTPFPSCPPPECVSIEPFPFLPRFPAWGFPAAVLASFVSIHFLPSPIDLELFRFVLLHFNVQ